MEDYNTLSEKYEYLAQRLVDFENETKRNIDWLLSGLDRVQDDIEAIKNNCPECDEDRDYKRLRALTNEFLDYKESIGKSDFVNKNVSLITGAALTWMEMNGDIFDGTRGEQGVISRVISKRYGLKNDNGYFRIPESDEQ